MAIGHPRLAVHYFDGTIRLYELASGVFVQLNSNGTYPHAPGSSHPDGVTFPPRVTFMKDSELVTLNHSPNANSHYQRNFDAELNLVSSSVNIANGQNLGVGPIGVNFADFTTAILPFPGTLFSNTMLAGSPGNQIPGGDATGGPTDDDIRALCFSPDGRGVMYLNTAATKLRSGRRVSYSSGVPRYADVQVVANAPYAITAGVWLNNEFFAGFGALGATLFRFDPTTGAAKVVLDIVKPVAGSPVAVAVSPQDGRRVAASFLDGGVYSTVVYRRVGPFPSVEQTISGFGQLLSFSQDGRLLVDAITKKAFELQGDTWVELSGAMANIAANAVAQALSTHIDNPVGFSTLYDNRLADLEAGSIDLDDLYLTLLTASAPAFDPTDTTATAAKGSAEVAGNWPVGGYPLTGVVGAADGARAWRISADEVEHLLYPNGFSFRYGLIYEKTTDKPVLFIDYQRNYDIARSSTLNLSFDAGLINITE